MKYVFFMNPVAGQGNNPKSLRDKIANSSFGEFDYKISITNAVGDGEKNARKIAEALDGEKARFFACGGDGTVNEIANGIVGFDNISLGIIPTGTGNDTVRNFGEVSDFLDLERQFKAEPKPVDLMSYEGIIDSRWQKRYCINMFNIGFDCNVVELAARLKEKPFISGSGAYLAAVLGIFIEKRGISLTIKEDDKLIRQGEMLLCAIANGSYCGGGVYSSPQASMDDGFFDVNIINDVPRRTFLKLFPKYQKGTHLDIPGIEKIVEVMKSKSITVEPYGKKDFFLCVDGEIFITEGVKIGMCEHAIKLLVPQPVE